MDTLQTNSGSMAAYAPNSLLEVYCRYTTWCPPGQPPASGVPFSDVFHWCVPATCSTQQQAARNHHLILTLSAAMQQGDPGIKKGAAGEWNLVQERSSRPQPRGTRWVGGLLGQGAGCSGGTQVYDTPAAGMHNCSPQPTTCDVH
jgi:hypothetical protein